MLDNQGYREKSEVSAQERVEFAAYREALLSLVPVNTNEKRHELRALIARTFPDTKPIFAELRLTF